MNKKKILVFLSYKVGFECLKFLLKKFKSDSYYVILTNNELKNNEIKKFLKEKKIKYNFFTKNIEKIIIKTNIKYDWIINLWGSIIIKKEILNKSRNSLNIHPGYLPNTRGKDPVYWAMKLEEFAGVTLHQMNEKVDEGKIWYRKKIFYKSPVKGKDLYQRVLKECVLFFKEKWGIIRNTKKKPFKQKRIRKTFKRKDMLSQRFIDLDKNNNLKNFFLNILSHDYTPNYSSRIKFKKKIYNIDIILRKKDEK